MESRPIYRTAADLGIRQDEHDALVGLVGPLSRDELPVDMRVFRSELNSCGTPRCIGGWMLHFAGRPLRYGDGDYSPSLRTLFWPPVTTRGYQATAPQAAAALVNFLVTGEPDWAGVTGTA